MFNSQGNEEISKMLQVFQKRTQNVLILAIISYYNKFMNRHKIYKIACAIIEYISTGLIWTYMNKKHEHYYQCLIIYRIVKYLKDNEKGRQLQRVNWTGLSVIQSQFQSLIIFPDSVKTRCCNTAWPVLRMSRTLHS